MKVKIDRDREGWFYAEGPDSPRTYAASYPEIKAKVFADGHELDHAGWAHRLLMWNFNSHALDGYPGWEIEADRSPAFVKLTHRRGPGRVESHALAAMWDDVASVDFYQRDWTEDGIPFVRDGETYWSGWWFATIAERNRFLAWHAATSASTTLPTGEG
jgi:hypothetical protein